MPRGHSPQKIRQWTERLKRFERSGVSVARFCQSEGISESSFYQWKRKLRKRANPNGLTVKADRSKFVAVDVVPTAVSQPLRATTIRLGRDVEI